ncbi:MAG: flagellar basal body-associated FliL family protein [Deltaproteobacteria bacterium]|nr:flagellar basal body-associated FliL family protein [Candidatus Anaeroferrophillus wilburensis]MBN2889583.1 flagellar basal body-associated FliL family protein [Deltaproteobacteria bacterium]
MAKKETSEENSEVTEQDGGKKPKKLFLIIIIIIALLVVGGGGFAIYYFFLAPKPPTAEELAQMEAAKRPKPEILPVFSLKPFVVNLAGGSGRRYLKVSMKLELSSEDLLAEIDKRQPQIRDVILTLLSSKTSDEVNSMEGKFILREEIVKRVNTFLITGKITKIYLEEFVVQ